MTRFKVGEKIREIAYGIESAETRARREREAKAREYARLMPTPEQVEREKKRVGIGSSRRRR